MKFAYHYFFGVFYIFTFGKKCNALSQILIEAEFKNIYSSLAPHNIFNIAVRQHNIFEFNNHDAYT